MRSVCEWSEGQNQSGQERTLPDGDPTFIQTLEDFWTQPLFVSPRRILQFNPKERLGPKVKNLLGFSLKQAEVEGDGRL